MAEEKMEHIINPVDAPVVSKRLEHRSRNQYRMGTTKLLERRVRAFAIAGDADGLRETFAEHGCDPRLRSPQGTTPMHTAAENGHLECAQVLAENGFDLGALDEGGNTPSHLAAKGGHLDLIRFLCDQLVVMSAENNAGDTPLALAERSGNDFAALIVRNYVEDTDDIIGRKRRAVEINKMEKLRKDKQYIFGFDMPGVDDAEFAMASHAANTDPKLKRDTMAGVRARAVMEFVSTKSIARVRDAYAMGGKKSSAYL
eukprot:CAMPEP_0118877630 /NCGR_PEP_ID=MMETSP1163-20130328/17856_1 /TAXON_ID=124430 /ORGANISM="Phaeomonas parva, Strain CCMP2877" /LENGTH=256 /DNA_ID=CAMNT_0006813361 /DNA_START=22 /DNA_END=792 /DNA_ORIENTATION=-